MLMFAVLGIQLPAARAQKPLNAGVAGAAINLIYAYVTQDAGLWKKYGLDVRVVLFESGSTLAQVARAT